MILIAFYLLGTTADGYLSPALEQIAKKLNMSEQMAGVTFLALANGAPDVIGAIVATDSEGGEVGLAVGALTGATLFVSGVVSAVIIIFSKTTLYVDRRVFYRDIGFLMGSIGILCLSSYVGHITLVFSLMFILLYVVFLVFVGIEDYKQKQKKKNEKTGLNESESLIESPSHEVTSPSIMMM